MQGGLELEVIHFYLILVYVLEYLLDIAIMSVKLTLLSVENFPESGKAL